MAYWLMKSEPNEFSIDDLYQRPAQIEPWDGVRNYQARNMLRDDMQFGDLAFFYHSNCELPGIVGVIEIVRTGYADDTAFDPNDRHFDPKSSPEKPTWYRVDVKFVKKLSRTISLKELKAHTDLATLSLVQRGNRLSIMPISEPQWHTILALE